MIATKERPKTAAKERISTTHPLTEEQIAQYHEDGFVIVRGFFDPQEVEAVRIACEEDPELGGQETEFTDSQGNTSRIAHWTELGDSLLGVIPRLARIVNAAETFLGGECYHWHSKLVKKRPCDHHNAIWNEPFVREGLEHRAYRPLSELPDSTILEGNYKGVFENHEFLGKQRGYQQIIKRRDMQ